MTRNPIAVSAGAALALLLCSQSALSNDTVRVSSLDGLRTAIDNAPSIGRTIVLAKGVYQQAETIHILGKRNLTITGATSDYDDTVIRGPGINNKSLGINFKLNNSDRVTIKNLTIRDSYYHAVQINNDSDYFTAYNVKTLDNGESGFKVTSPSNASGPAAYSDNGTIKNSFIGFTDAGQRGSVEGVDIVAANRWRVSNNEFENIRKPNGGAAYALFAKGNSQNIVFENNTVRNSMIALSFGGGGTNPRYFRDGDTSYETRGGVIRDNLIHDVADAGIYMNRAYDFKVIGNTVVRSGKNTGAIEARFAESSGIISRNKVSGPIKLRDGATAMTSHNTTIARDARIPE